MSQASLKMSSDMTRPFSMNEPPTEQGPLGKHPVEKIQLTHMHKAIEQEDIMLGMTFGSYAPFQRHMERTLLSQFQRLPGLPSSLSGLKTVMDMDETIEFEDYLNLEENDPMDRVGPLHAVMQARFM